MPAKKTPGTAVAPKSQGNIVSIQDQLAADVAALKNQIAPVTGQQIRVTQDKRFKFPDGSEGPGPFAAVVVDFVTMKRYYQNDYDPDHIAPPECFAISREPKGMNPSPNAPVMQNTPEKGGCDTCPQNQWGSDPKRDGKACKEHRRLAVLPAPDGKSPLTQDTPIWILDVSPTGLKAFDSFIAGVAKTFNAPPVGVTVDVGFDPQRQYPSVRLGDPQSNPEVVAYRGRKEEAMELLMTEPDVSGYGAEPPPKAPARGRMGGGAAKRR